MSLDILQRTLFIVDEQRINYTRPWQNRKVASLHGNAPWSGGWKPPDLTFNLQGHWKSNGCLLCKHTLKWQLWRDLNPQIPPWEGGDYNQFVYRAIEIEIQLNDIALYLMWQSLPHGSLFCFGQSLANLSTIIGNDEWSRTIMFDCITKRLENCLAIFN